MCANSCNKFVSSRSWSIIELLTVLLCEGHLCPRCTPFKVQGAVPPQCTTVLASLLVSRAGLFGPSVSLSKYFGPIAGLHTKFFNNTKSNNFFLPWCTFVMVNALTYVSQVMAIFLQIILLANTSAFGCYLLGLVSHSFWEGDNGEEISTQWRCFEKINHLCDSCFL